MKLLLITNYNHKASKQLVRYLELKKINFDCIDSSKKKKIKISKKYDYLISFLNSKYISKSVRKKIKINSFNFHPGPPEYPGFGCYNFALLDKVNFYGSTIHIINDKFDNGKILNVNKFKISYEKLSLEKNTRLFLATNQEHYRANYLMNNLKLSDYFEDIFHSAKIGFCKTDKEYYQIVDKALGDYETTPIFFDDTPKVVDAANKHGWNAYQFYDFSSFKQCEFTKIKMPSHNE